MSEADQVPYDALGSELFGSFATYLATITRASCKVNQKLIAFKSADSYLSAMKSFYCGHLYKDKFERPVFQKIQWATIRAGIAGIFKNVRLKHEQKFWMAKRLQLRKMPR